MTILDQQYKLPSSVVTRRKGDKYLFLNPDLPAWVITNSNGAKALQLCDGRRTVREIVKTISRFIQRDATDEIKAFLKEATEDSNLFAAPREGAPPSSGCNLNVVHLNLTNKCNLECVYCYADERSGYNGGLGSADYLKLIDSINNISRSVTVVFTGGEPLLNEKVLDIARYAKKKGNKAHLLTNGVLIDDENSKQIAGIFDLVKVSLDGSSREINDFHRGKGVFDKTLEAIDRLIKNKASLQISMTVTKRNIGDIKAMARSFGALLTFAPLFMAGRANSNRKLAITGREYYSALASIKGVNPLSNMCSTFERAQNRRILKCAIGDAEISISDTGEVYPCHLLHLPQFLAGNIKEQPLEAIYETSEVLKACRNLNVYEINGCKKCNVRFICGGACRARAFHEKKRIDVSDDFCEYEKQAFINGLFDLHEL